MGRDPVALEPGLITRTPVRALFTDLLAGALDRTRMWPSPLAVAYLAELLEGRLRAAPEPGADEPVLAEALLPPCGETRAQRIGRLRSLGDRTLFVSGYFADSLARRTSGLSWYGDAGRMAYSGVSAALRGRLPRPRTGAAPAPVARGSLAAQGVAAPFPELFEELADCFAEFAEVLGEVADASRAHSRDGLLHLYERYLRSGSARDRRRLMRRGLVVCAAPDGSCEQ